MAPRPERRLTLAYTDPISMREALAVMEERRGYCSGWVEEHEGRDRMQLDVSIPLTGPLVTVGHDGRETRHATSPWNPRGPNTVTAAFSWFVDRHSYAVVPEKAADFARYASNHPERIWGQHD